MDNVTESSIEQRELVNVQEQQSLDSESPKKTERPKITTCSEQSLAQSGEITDATQPRGSIEVKANTNLKEEPPNAINSYIVPEISGTESR